MNCFVVFPDGGPDPCPVDSHLKFPEACRRSIRGLEGLAAGVNPFCSLRHFQMGVDGTGVLFLCFVVFLFCCCSVCFELFCFICCFVLFCMLVFVCVFVVVFCVFLSFFVTEAPMTVGSKGRIQAPSSDCTKIGAVSSH